MTTKDSSFAERLQALRGQKNLSQYALAKQTGLSKQAISQLEMGGSDPAWTTVQLLAAALDVDYAEFADPAVNLPPPIRSQPRGRPRKDQPPNVAPTDKKARDRGKVKRPKSVNVD